MFNVTDRPLMSWNTWGACNTVLDQDLRCESVLSFMIADCAPRSYVKIHPEKVARGLDRPFKSVPTEARYSFLLGFLEVLHPHQIDQKKRLGTKYIGTQIFLDLS